MDGSEFHALAELDRVLGGEALASRPGPNSMPEWDYLYALPKRTLRRLRGARYMRRGGMQPDELAQLIVGRVAGVVDDGDAMRWYVKTCLAAIGEARIVARRRRHLSLAWRNGHLTYYQYRSAMARAMGYRSLYHMRVERGWDKRRGPDHDWRTWRTYLDSLGDTA